MAKELAFSSIFILLFVVDYSSSSTLLHSEEPDTIEEQLTVLQEVENECMLKMQKEENQKRDNLISQDSDFTLENQTTLDKSSQQLFCPVEFDDVYCWPQTPRNTTVMIPCPSYIQGFSDKGFASRFCTAEGKWYMQDGENESWTNYSMCSMNDAINEESLKVQWVPIVAMVSKVGYGVSLVTLIVATSILASIKRLKCPRNSLHMHLFFSFMWRAFGALARGEHFVSSTLSLREEESGTWWCRVLMSLWQYFILANYSWILMEGLYLHNLIFLALFTDTSAITMYVLLGWGLPIPLSVGWAVARLTLENSHCWTTNSFQWIFWAFIRGPITVSILINFVMFVNITRELLLKLKTSYSQENRKFRRWAKSTLVLVPLFGVHYAALLGFTYFIDKNDVIELAWLMADQFFASFQGFFVAVLYCLLNAEVRNEMRKNWKLWRMRKDPIGANSYSLTTVQRGHVSQTGGSTTQAVPVEQQSSAAVFSWQKVKSSGDKQHESLCNEEIVNLHRFDENSDSAVQTLNDVYLKDTGLVDANADDVLYNSTNNRRFDAEVTKMAELLQPNGQESEEGIALSTER